jgi:hypothetical protein
LQKLGRHNVPPNYRIEKCSKKPLKQEARGFPQIFVIFLSLAISLNFIISSKKNSYKKIQRFQKKCNYGET